MPSMSRDVALYLEDMLDAARRAVSYVAGMDFDQYLADRRTRDAVERVVEILGEAAKKVPADVRASMPGIDWREACAFRDVLAHRYFGLDDRIVWEVVRHSVFRGSSPDSRRTWPLRGDPPAGVLQLVVRSARRVPGRPPPAAPLP